MEVRYLDSSEKKKVQESLGGGIPGGFGIFCGLLYGRKDKGQPDSGS